MPNATMQAQRSAMAIFAHELREPLFSILLAAHGMAKSASDSSAQHELGRLIERQGLYMSKLIDRALLAENGRVEGLHLCVERFDFLSVARDALQVVAPSVRIKSQRLDTVLPTGPLCMVGDPVRVQQVLINLLANAVKYTPREGWIQFSVEGSADGVVIKASDNGIGIEPAMLQRVFNQFERGNVPPPLDGYTGLGVGLAVVKALVEWHGGTVSAHSEGTGTGSTFVVRLPCTGSLDIDSEANCPRTPTRPASNGSWMTDA